MQHKMKTDNVIFNDFCNEFFPDISETLRKKFKKQINDMLMFQYYKLGIRVDEFKKIMADAFLKPLKRLKKIKF